LAADTTRRRKNGKKMTRYSTKLIATSGVSEKKLKQREYRNLVPRNERMYPTSKLNQ